MNKDIKEFREKFVGNDGRVYSGTLTSGKIETFWLSKLKAQNQELLEKYKRAFFKVFGDLSDKTWDNCFANKMSIDEVKEEDWQKSSATFEELWEAIKKLIK